MRGYRQKTNCWMSSNRVINRLLLKGLALNVYNNYDLSHYICINGLWPGVGILNLLRIISAVVLIKVKGYVFQYIGPMVACTTCV